MSTWKLLSVCGVDCKPFDDRCNGYCRGDAKLPAQLRGSAFEVELQRQKPTKATILSTVKSEHYWQVPGTYMTICALVLRNGFTVTGESACATPDEFDVEIGQRVARENALHKIKSFECYALRERLVAAGVKR